MICPNCNEPTGSVKSVITHGRIVVGCDNCSSHLVKGTDLAASNHRKADQRKFAADLIQPFEKDYAKLYGEDNAREHGWDDEALRRHG